MQRRMAVIELLGEERQDGTVCIHSPNVPLFHVVAPNLAEALPTALPILKEHLERNLGKEVTLTVVDAEIQEAVGAPQPNVIPPHVIAEVAAP